MKQDEILKNLPQLQTERLILCKMSMDDAQDMFEYASDPEVTRYVTWPAHASIENTRGFLSYVLQRYENGEAADWGLVLKENLKLIGTCGFVWWNRQHFSAEIGYVLSRKYWGQGLMTEAVREVIRFGFDAMGLNRIEAQHILENEASGRVMQKAGMTFEGVLRQRMFVRERFWSTKQYSILRNEYETANNDS